MKMHKWIILSFFLLAFTACGDTTNPSGNSIGSTSGNNDGSWLIPKEEVVDGGPGKDGIPALTEPEFAAISQIDYLSDNDLVLGFKSGNTIRAYSHAILDWHEIINDEVNGTSIAITYCPLTGTGIGWDRNINGRTTTFGVSGLLYNSNLIPYDRNSNSNWSQIKLLCVNGSLQNTEIKTLQVVETNWRTWKAMYPDSKILTTNTGFNRNYSRYPYGDYKTNNQRFLFSVNPKDARIPSKERVLGVIVENEAKIYRFGSFTNGTEVIHDTFNNKNLVIVGDKSRNYMVAYENNLDGQTLTFQAIDNDKEEVMTDQSGSVWNIFGEAISGENQGRRLTQVNSFIGFWFSWGAFYPEPLIFGN